MFGHYPAYPKGLDQTHTEMSRGNVKRDQGISIYECKVNLWQKSKL